jgi:hypothetical protein
VLRGRPGSKWWLGALALAPLLALLVVGLPGERGCGGELGALPAKADQALPCDTPMAAASTLAPKTLVYLARDGVTLTAGADDATKNVSQVLQTKNLPELAVPAAGYDAAMWKSIEACLKQRFAAYDVGFVTERPAQGPYLMAVFGGTGEHLGFGADIKGTAPLDAVGCKTSPSAVALVFSAQLGADPLLHCEIAAQEIAHAFSADHVVLAEDAMSYLSAGGPKTFRDTAAPCGETEARPCVCGRPSQNSHQLLLERIGPTRTGSDVAPPEVSVRWTRSRGNSANITVQAVDDRAVANVELTIEGPAGVVRSKCGDSNVTCTPSAGGWLFQVPGVEDGARFSVSAQDGVGNLASTPPEPFSSANAALVRTWASVAVRPGEPGKVLWVTAYVEPATQPLSGARLKWTDGVGTQELPMCPGEHGTWFLPIAADQNLSVRQLELEVRDENGPVATSASQALALP